MAIRAAIPARHRKPGTGRGIPTRPHLGRRAGRRRPSGRLPADMAGLTALSNWLSQPLLHEAHTIMTVVLNSFADHWRGSRFSGPA